MSDSYFFLSRNITVAQVQSIIDQAEYRSADYNYTQLLDRTGVEAEGTPVMNVNRLERAAKDLRIRVEISSGPAASGIARGDAGSDPESDLAFAIASTPYSVTISMSGSTVQTLLASNFQLYGFKAVQTTLGGGAPTVWFKTGTFSSTTAVNWTEQYQAYTSTTVNFGPNTQIVASDSQNINLGQTMTVAAGGIGTVVNGGTTSAISIFNTTSTQFTCGINQMQSVNGAQVPTPLCAFPLYGNMLDVIAPIERVLLMFSTLPVNTGTVIYQAYSQGVLIDLTSVQQRAVTFDINAGWSWGGGSWGQSVAANANLVPLLIETPSRTFRTDLSNYLAEQALLVR